MKKYRFFFHYNKGKDKLTVHFRKACHIVDEVVCLSPCNSKRNKIQPRVVMQGMEKDVLVENNKAIII